MSDNKDLKDSKEPGIGPGRRKTVRKGMFSKDCKFSISVYYILFIDQHFYC
jgi:hypothetical protein